MAVDVLTGSALQIQDAFKAVLSSVSYDDGSGTARTSLGHAIAEKNAALLADGQPERVSDLVTARICLREDALQDPGDCPHVRVVWGEALSSRSHAWGSGNEGAALYRVPVVSYLTQATPETGDADLEESLARQTFAWIECLTRAIRRRGANGLWGQAAGTILELDLDGTTIGTYAVSDVEGVTLARAARVVQTWRIKQDIYY